MITGNEPAFPLITSGGSIQDGMTYRQWLAGMVLQGIMASNECSIGHHPPTAAEWAVAAADALINELNKQS